MSSPSSYSKSLKPGLENCLSLAASFHLCSAARQRPRWKGPTPRSYLSFSYIRRRGSQQPTSCEITLGGGRGRRPTRPPHLEQLLTNYLLTLPYEVYTHTDAHTHMHTQMHTHMHTYTRALSPYPTLKNPYHRPGTGARDVGPSN